MAESDTASGQVIRGQLDHHAVAGKDTDVVLAHAPAQMPKDLVTVLQLHLELRVWQGLQNRSFNGNRIRILSSWSCLGGRRRCYTTTSTLLLLLCLCLLNQIQYLISYTQRGSPYLPGE